MKKDSAVGFDPKDMADGYLRHAAELRSDRPIDIDDTYVETSDELAYDALIRLIHDG